jgi:ribosome-binding protein aMBF1 (putative translation factor)
MKAQYPPDSLPAKVGQRIRTLRTGKGLCLRTLGKMASRSPFHIMSIELGRLAPNTKTLRSIATALDVAPADLVNCENDDIENIIEMMRKSTPLFSLAKTFLSRV